MFKLQFSTANAAFQFSDGDVNPFAIAETLRKIADRIETESEFEGSVRDVNGNYVGAYGLESSED